MLLGLGFILIFICWNYTWFGDSFPRRIMSNKVFKELWTMSENCCRVWAEKLKLSVQNEMTTKRHFDMCNPYLKKKENQKSLLQNSKGRKYKWKKGNKCSIILCKIINICSSTSFFLFLLICSQMSTLSKTQLKRYVCPRQQEVTHKLGLEEEGTW